MDNDFENQAKTIAAETASALSKMLDDSGFGGSSDSQQYKTAGQPSFKEERITSIKPGDNSGGGGGSGGPGALAGSEVKNGAGADKRKGGGGSGEPGAGSEIKNGAGADNRKTGANGAGADSKNSGANSAGADSKNSGANSAGADSKNSGTSSGSSDSKNGSTNGAGADAGSGTNEAGADANHTGSDSKNSSTNHAGSDSQDHGTPKPSEKPGASTPTPETLDKILTDALKSKPNAMQSLKDIANSSAMDSLKKLSIEIPSIEDVIRGPRR